MRSGEEPERLFEATSIPSPAWSVFQAASGNSNRRSPTALDTLDPCCGLPATPADYNLNGESTELTDLEQVIDRGHSLSIEERWCQVAESCWDG
jgi:non-heme chloroperoxidase